MGFKIISNKDKNGNFVAANEAWTPEKIEELMDKYYPNRANKRAKLKEKENQKKE